MYMAMKRILRYMYNQAIIIYVKGCRKKPIRMHHICHSFQKVVYLLKHLVLLFKETYIITCHLLGI